VVLSSTASGTVSFGIPVTFTADLTDPDTGVVPVGQVQFWDGTTLLATASLNGQGKASLTRSLARGTHAITAVYLGNANCNGSTSGAAALTVT
jgi:5'-nucleotidase